MRVPVRVRATRPEAPRAQPVHVPGCACGRPPEARRPASHPATALATALLAVLVAACDANPFTPAFQPVTYIAVEAGGGHSCGLAVDGVLYCWGRGVDGQLGDGAATRSADPVRAGDDGAVFASIALGKDHSCALTADGRAWCWGANGSGQLGIGSTTAAATPRAVATDLTFATLSAGSFHTCGVTAAGAAWCWGRNVVGQLGDGGTDGATTPVRVGADADANGLTFASISAGGFHTCGLTADGMAYCWGANNQGQLGVGDRVDRTEPTPVDGGLRFSRVAAGGMHSCATEAGGQSHCWGSALHGEVGNGWILTPFDPPFAQPMPVHQLRHDGRPDHLEIAAGLHFACATDSQRRAWCWGLGYDGQLGGNNLRLQATPYQVFATLDIRFTGISTGHGTHACGITDSFGAYCWGTSDDGGLGPGTTFSTQPVRIPGPR